MMCLIIHYLFHYDVKQSDNHMRVTSAQRNIYRVCSRIGQQKKVVMWSCICFVDGLITTFCFGLRTICREMESQASCASGHCKVVDTAINTLL